MCLIIDANSTSAVTNGDPDMKPIMQWLLKDHAHVAVGGAKLAEEYRKVPKFVSFLANLDAAGKVRRFPDKKVDDCESDSVEKFDLASDDSHIIALAMTSGSRLLLSKDENLHKDFGNIEILKPKGKIYQTAAHAHLLFNPPKCATA